MKPLLAVALVLLVAGIALVVLSDALAADVAGIVLCGVAGVLAISAVFYAIGRSEDEERARASR